MGITTKTDEKILSELNLMVQVGSTPVECVEALKGKMSHSSVYKFYNRFKIQTHHKAVDNAKEEKAVNVSREVVKEPVSKNEQFKEESTHIINELSGKNEELQKELHTQKVVIETLQNGVDELNEAITESKIMIAEIAKERDGKDEKIRVLNLELQKYKNDLSSVLDDRQKLECLLSDNANENKNVLNNNNNKEWSNKHYDYFYNLTEQDIKKGKIKIDPYFVGKQWGIGVNDNSGILAHQLKTIARFGLKNSVEREIKAIYNQAKRMMELYNIQEEK